jgi:hypothetical protein
VEELEFSDIRRVYGDGSSMARQNQRLKSYTMVFGTNGALIQHQYKKIGKNEKVYRAMLRRLLDEAGREGVFGEPCDLTGIRSNLDFGNLSSEALRESGLPASDQMKWVGRDWIPLGGSLGNDAQALPGASRPLHVSALALFTLQYLPLGTFLFKGKLTCFQSTAAQLAQDLVGNVVRKNNASLDREILGKGEGTKVVLEFLLNLFSELKEHRDENVLPPNTELLLWLFSNSGTGADCALEAIPDHALRFAFDASAQFNYEIRKLFARDPKDSRFQLFESIRARRDYPGLYPLKGWPGASSAFYSFYQLSVRGVDPTALLVAKRVAEIIVQQTAAKDRKTIRKPEFLRSNTGKNRVRQAISENLSLAEYDALFPSTRHPIRTSADGWNFIHFYLAKEDPQMGTYAPPVALKTTHPKIVEIGNAYFDQKGSKKVKNVLDRLAQRKLGVAWLQDVFCRLAEDPRYKDFNFGTWDEFACDEDGRPRVFELLFQLRLYLANKYRENSSENQELTA